MKKREEREEKEKEKEKEKEEKIRTNVPLSNTDQTREERDKERDAKGVDYLFNFFMIILNFFCCSRF